MLKSNIFSTLLMRKQLDGAISAIVPFILDLARKSGPIISSTLIILLKVGKQVLKWFIIIGLFVIYFEIHLIMWISTTLQFESNKKFSLLDMFIPFNANRHYRERYERETRQGMMAGYNKFFVGAFLWILSW